MNKFISDANLTYKIDSSDFHEYLADVGAVQFDKKYNVFRPTGIGILLFGKNPRSKYKQAAFMASVNYGNNKIEPKTFEQPLVLLPDLISEWLRKTLPLSKNTSSFKRKEIPDFPIEVIREAVMNALIHRDYIIEGGKSSIEIDNDKIIVKSLGAPLPSISIEQLNAFKAPSISRNPIITYVFNLMGYVEENGFGMEILKSLYIKFGLPLPEYKFQEPFLSLTFPRNLEAVAKVSQYPKLLKLNAGEIQGYEFIKLKEEISKKEYAEHFGYDEKKAYRHLSKMRKLELIRDNGEPNKSNKFRYIYKPENKSMDIKK